MILFDLLPEKARPYAKSVIAALGLVLSAVSVAIPQAPEWVPVALAFLTALGVYQVPNESTGGDVTDGV